MKMIARLSLLVLVFLVSACATSNVQAPVVGGSVDIQPEVKEPNARNENVQSQVDEPFLESSPLPSRGALEPKAIEKKRGTVSPVLRSLLARSETASELGDWQQSEVYLERALSIEPKNALVWHRMALVKLQQSKNNQAIQFASKSNVLARSDEALKRRNWGVIADANTALNRPEKASQARAKSSAF